MPGSRFTPACAEIDDRGTCYRDGRPTMPLVHAAPDNETKGGVSAMFDRPIVTRNSPKMPAPPHHTVGHGRNPTHRGNPWMHNSLPLLYKHLLCKITAHVTDSRLSKFEISADRRLSGYCTTAAHQPHWPLFRFR